MIFRLSDGSLPRSPKKLREQLNQTWAGRASSRLARTGSRSDATHRKRVAHSDFDDSDTRRRQRASDHILNAISVAHRFVPRAHGRGEQTEVRIRQIDTVSASITR